MQIGNNNKMETQVAYTTPTKPNVSHTRKEVRKAKPIPELWSATLWSHGYMSLDEFGSIFHPRLQEGFAMVRGETARKRQFSAALRAIKTALRRLFQ